MKRNASVGIWCVAGDFNAIKTKVESKGQRVVVNIGEMVKFGNFIGRMDLGGVPLFGGKFTWIKSYGSVTSKLDIFILS